MKTIKVICGGCGIKYTENGMTRHALKTPADGAFLCEDAQADRLVNLGVAVYVDAAVIEIQDSAPDDDLAAELEAMSYNDIKKLAALKGLKPDGTKKADYIAAILEATETNEVIDEDELPNLSVAMPE